MPSYTITSARLSYAGAARMLAAAVAKAEAMRIPACVAVTDPGGNAIAFARIDGAAGLASGPAFRKATVAAERGHASGALPKEYEIGVAFATEGRYTNLPGGLPVVIDGQVVGGIGVSGGSGDDDLAIARAGLAAIGAGEKA
jgi:uncharacterized protein GlcG (DUF336 family)